MATLGANGRTQGRPGWPLQVYFTALAAMVMVVASAAGVYVSVQSGVDAKQLATADANFAAHKAATEIAASLAIIRAVSTQVVDGQSTLATDFTDPSACKLAFAPVGVFESGRPFIKGAAAPAPGAGGRAWAGGHPG